MLREESTSMCTIIIMQSKAIYKRRMKANEHDAFISWPFIWQGYAG